MQESERWCKMVQAGARWCKRVQDGARWCKMVQDGAGWCKRVQDGARWCKIMQYHEMPCNTMQYYATSCNTMQYHASLITADGAYHCPVGSIMAIFWILCNLPVPGHFHGVSLLQSSNTDRRDPFSRLFGSSCNKRGQEGTYKWSTHTNKHKLHTLFSPVWLK